MEQSGHLDLNQLRPSLEQDLHGIHREEVLKDAIADAAMTGGDSMVIESGAGAGKTTILARRILSLMDGGARPEEFAILTYTREAADELRYKISKYRQIHRMRIATIYEFGRSVLSAYAKATDLTRVPDHAVPARLLEQLEGDASMLQMLRRQYRYIYMDEFQDADRVVSRLLRLLAVGNPRTEDGRLLRDGALFVVGDPRQTIYHEGRERYDAFAQMKAWMREQQALGAHVNIVTFRLNFRTDQEILDYINRRFGSSIPGYVDMQAGRKSNFPVQGVHTLGSGSQTMEEQARQVGRVMQRLMEQHRTLNYRNFLVITWNEAARELYASVLEGEGIHTDQCSRTEADRSNVVRVMDIYEAKGLAGDVVFIESEEALDTMEEGNARRLEYVAATRARHALIYSGARMT